MGGSTARGAMKKARERADAEGSVEVAEGAAPKTPTTASKATTAPKAAAAPKATSAAKSKTGSKSASDKKSTTAPKNAKGKKATTNAANNATKVTSTAKDVESAATKKRKRDVNDDVDVDEDIDENKDNNDIPAYANAQGKVISSQAPEDLKDLDAASDDEIAEAVKGSKLAKSIKAAKAIKAAKVAKFKAKEVTNDVKQAKLAKSGKGTKGTKGVETVKGVKVAKPVDVKKEEASEDEDVADTTVEDVAGADEELDKDNAQVKNGGGEVIVHGGVGFGGDEDNANDAENVKGGDGADAEGNAAMEVDDEGGEEQECREDGVVDDGASAVDQDMDSSIDANQHSNADPKQNAQDLKDPILNNGSAASNALDAPNALDASVVTDAPNAPNAPVVPETHTTPTILPASPQSSPPFESDAWLEREMKGQEMKWDGGI